MKRLRRRSGLVLAALAVASSALLVAPVTTAPAQANHITTYDNEDWIFDKTGSWWFAVVRNCFTTNLEYLLSVHITNNGSQSHQFKWVWTDFNGGAASWSEWTTIAGNGGDHWWFAPHNSTWGALLQADHPRVQLYWINSAGDHVLLWSLHGWDPPNSYSDRYEVTHTTNCVT